MAEVNTLEYEANITWDDNGNLVLKYDTGSVMNIILPIDEKYTLPDVMELRINGLPVILTFKELTIA